MKPTEMTGLTFGRLTVVSEAEGRRDARGRTRRFFLMRCSCGNEIVAEGAALRGGNTRSCGCLKREKAAAISLKHGATRNGRWTPEYRAYVGMRDRCLNPRDVSNWKNYGGRGIRICDRWLRGADGKSGFQCFFEDVGLRPSKLHSLDRHPNNDGNYEPGNVRWATKTQQQNNKRAKLTVTISGKSMSLVAACRKFGVAPDTARHRLRWGWTADEAVGAIPRAIDHSTPAKIPPVSYSGKQNGKWTPEYGTYWSMIQRCRDRKSQAWKNYGGRGIRVCDRWLNGENGERGFACFLADVGLRPSTNHSLDRYPDNDGNYEPGNVRWATPAQQTHNRRAIRQRPVCR